MFLEDASLKTEGLQLQYEEDIADLGDLSGFQSDRTDNMPDSEEQVNIQ